MPIRGGGSVIRLLQSLFQSLIGSLGISYCGTNKTPPPLARAKHLLSLQPFVGFIVIVLFHLVLSQR